jgi:hypothetical protein
MMKVAGLIVARFHPAFKQDRSLREALASDFSSQELKTFATSLSLERAKLDQLDGRRFLHTLEILTAFTQMKPQSPADFALNNIDLPSPADDWTTD